MTPVKDVLIKPKVVESVEFTPFDPWSPVLKNSPSLQTTPEQELYIKEILEICCSDSAFAKKAYLALQYILTGAPPVPAVVTSINPSTAAISTPITLVVTGTGFTPDSKILFGGVTTTVFVSDTELSADVTTPGTEGVVPVSVTDINEVPSNSVDFTVTAVTLLSVPSGKKFEEPKKEEKK